MKYIVKIPRDKLEYPYIWIKDSEFSTIEEAQKRAIEITGIADCYTEPGGGLAKGFFGNYDKDSGWNAMIEVLD